MFYLTPIFSINFAVKALKVFGTVLYIQSCLYLIDVAASIEADEFSLIDITIRIPPNPVELNIKKKERINEENGLKKYIHF